LGSQDFVGSFGRFCGVLVGVGGEEDGRFVMKREESFVMKE